MGGGGVGLYISPIVNVIQRCIYHHLKVLGWH